MVEINNFLVIFLVIVLFYVIIPRRNKFYLGIIKRKKKGEIRKMPEELINDFIGKVCTIIFV